jgi:hypothetical protein
VRALAESIDAMQAEARVHRTLLSLGRNVKIRAALDEIYDDPEAGRRIADDAAGFIRSTGVDLGGADVEVTLGGEDADTILEARFREGALSYTVAWRRSDGFLLTGA